MAPVVIIGTAYWYCHDGERRAVLSHHPQWMPAGHFMATTDASAFRWDPTSEQVLCSGGPSPLIPASVLVYAGRTTQQFWAFKDGIVGPGRREDYDMEVNLWRWDGASEQ